MQNILAVTLPFFALVVCGYLAAQRRVLPESAIPGLNAYVLFFALPCMLFRFGASKPLASLVDPMLIAIYLVCGLLVVSITIGLTVRLKAGGPGVDLKNASFGALVAAFPNSGFMGVPLLVALMGESAAGPVIGTILVDILITSTLCIGLAQHQPRQPDSPQVSLGATAWRALKGPLINPLPWAIGLGALWGSTRLPMPSPVSQVIAMMADSASPVALFTIGAVLWRSGQHLHSRTPVNHYLPVALIKLLVHPALVWGVGAIAVTLNAPVSPQGLTVLVLAAALPSASNVSLLAERYGADNGRVARIIMASTILAFGTFTLLAWALGVVAKAAG